MTTVAIAMFLFLAANVGLIYAAKTIHSIAGIILAALGVTTLMALGYMFLTGAWTL